MKRSIIKYITLSFIALYSLQGMAQQDPQFTQYMYNMSAINPAYAIDDEGTLNIGGIYRNQWVGMEGAPETANFFAHTQLAPRLEAGITFVHDQIKIVKENTINIDVAYILPVSRNSKFSFGVKGGVNFFDADPSNLSTPEQGYDPALQNKSEVFPTFGVGAYLFGDKYYLGLSAPNIFTTDHLENEDELAGLAEEEIHYFLTGGYVFDLNPNLKLKPAFLLRAVEGAPLAVDVTANFLLHNRLELGVGYRLDDAVSGLVNFRVTPQLRIGYAYDYTTTRIGDFNDGTHEIMLLFDLNLLGTPKGYSKSPRFF